MNTQTDGNIDFNDTSAYPVHTINSPGGEIQKIQSETTGMGYKLFKLNGRLIDRKEALFDHIAKEMMFPDYFGNNWDALEECMRDLIEAVPASGYIVLFEDAHIFCNAAPDDFLTFVDIVTGVADEWIDEEIPLLLVLAGDVSLRIFNYGDLKKRLHICAN
jgi:RNAse (barnase) inhibitor barstar